MKKVVKVATPAAIAVLRQATELWPRRKRLSDGLLPSSAHLAQSPDSDHNTGLAVDLTHDPVAGVDCAFLYQQLKSDVRVSYLIFNGRIWSKEKGDRKYTGANRHDKHLHISIKPGGFSKDTRPWFPWVGEPKRFNKVRAKLKKTKVTKKATPSPKED